VQDTNAWIDLWRELALLLRRPADESRPAADPWQERASRFDASTRRREQGDPLLDSLIQMVNPADTLLDIGAGTGRWAVPLAGVVKSVSALDASPAMLDILKSNTDAADATNVAVLQGDWGSVEVAPHDVALSSHAMYTHPDLPAFIRKMERAALRTCVLAMRVPSHDGIIGQLSHRIHGQWHDSPNFVIAYNILLRMGVCPNVLMEQQMRHWTDDNFEDAVVRAKRRLRLGERTEHDETIRTTLREHLAQREDRWVWPDGMRSALVWWSPSRA
jgi:SAM-dependent methyltransferase